MKKNKLKEAVKETKQGTKEALQTVYDSLNNGQKKQIVKVQKVKELFELYGVEL